MARVLRSIGRHRPWVIAVASVALIVLLPGANHHRGAQIVTDQAAPAEPGVTIPGQSPSATGAAGVGDAATSNAGAQSGARGAAQSQTAAPSSGSRPAVTTNRSQSSAAPVGAPGVGTAAALAAPDCDPATGKIRVPYLFAPRCVVPWPAGADNGGSTSLGVTADAIRIVIYNDSSQTAALGGAFGSQVSSAQNQQARDAATNAVQMFNHVYRTWGRTVQVSFFDGNGADEVGQRADAVKIAGSIKPFAVFDHSGTHVVLYRELAARGVISMVSAVSEKETLAAAPYIWSVTLPPDELLEQSVAEYVGKRLVNRPAKWAGDPASTVKMRVIGLVRPTTWDPAIFTHELGRYGGTVASDNEYDANDLAGEQERSRTIIARLKGAGVTTVVAGADVLFTPTLTKEATSQQYFPEWVVTSVLGQDLDLFARLDDQTQWRHAFGVGASVGVASSQPLPQDVLYSWYWGASSSDASGATVDLAPFFKGVHLAGPHLTPSTFRDALFSQPPAGGSACHCVLYPQASYGRWGIMPTDDYTGFDDFTEVWWDPTAEGPDNANLAPGNGVGKYRYVDGGKRYLLGGWPTTEPKAFDPAGAVTYYDTPPPSDRPPGPYPCLQCPGHG